MLFDNLIYGRKQGSRVKIPRSAATVKIEPMSRLQARILLRPLEQAATSHGKGFETRRFQETSAFCNHRVAASIDAAFLFSQENKNISIIVILSISPRMFVAVCLHRIATGQGAPRLQWWLANSSRHVEEEEA